MKKNDDGNDAKVGGMATELTQSYPITTKEDQGNLSSSYYGKKHYTLSGLPTIAKEKFL